MFDLKKQDKIFDHILKYNGAAFTFDGELFNSKKGYYVPFDFDIIIPFEGMTAFKLINHINDILAKLDVDPVTHILEINVSDGNLEIDVAVHIQDRLAAIQKAFEVDSLKGLWDLEQGTHMATKEKD